ncbi:MAG: hypothetical protein AB7G11_03200 [Phycisphaerales bacterium]
MARGQEYSGYQRKVINRYYQHLDTITAQRLGEIVSELALCSDAKKADRLWERARVALEKTPINKVEVQKILASKDLPGLARLISKSA